MNTKALSPGTEVSVLGNKLRVLRGTARLTLQQLSKRTGISVSTLSKIENGQLSPTYEKIAALASGLQVEVGELFRGPERPAVHARRSVTLRDQGVFHRTRQYEYEVLHSDLVDKRFIPLVTTIKAHDTADFPELLRHDGEEFIYVLSGTVMVHTDCYAPLQLVEGDSCYFDSTMGHVIVSAGPDDAKILWVSSHVAL
ncbi:helix-turn-helix domain-containing protein [Thauera sp.]|uniref:helix-turn-helix domain-containing protein n=1 Tax=Thauera sp. TaxID=1905334 RepID=UPI0039E6C7C5